MTLADALKPPIWRAVVPIPELPEGHCQFEGRIIPLVDVPEWAFEMEVYDNATGCRTGETIGDLVRLARARSNP